MAEAGELLVLGIEVAENVTGLSSATKEAHKCRGPSTDGEEKVTD